MAIKKQTGPLDTAISAEKFTLQNASGQYWNTSGTPAFEDEDDSHWTDYLISASQLGTTGVFLGTIPAVPAGGSYTATWYDCSAGTSLAEVVPNWQSEPFWSDGSNETTASGPVTTTFALKKDTAFTNFTFVMLDATTRLPATGATVTATRSLDGGSFGACANAVAEIGNGFYKINLATTDLNAISIGLLFTATGCAPNAITIITQS